MFTSVCVHVFDGLDVYATAIVIVTLDDTLIGWISGECIINIGFVIKYNVLCIFLRLNSDIKCCYISFFYILIS